MGDCQSEAKPEGIFAPARRVKRLNGTRGDGLVGQCVCVMGQIIREFQNKIFGTIDRHTNL